MQRHCEKYLGACARTLSAYRNDRSGALAIMFALLFVPILSLIVAAIDYGLIYRVKSGLQDTTDAAISVAISRIGEGDAAVKQAFDQAFKANLKPSLRDVPIESRLEIDRPRLKVHVTAKVWTISNLILDREDPKVGFSSTAHEPKNKIGTLLKGAPAAPAVKDVDKAEIERQISKSLDALRRLGIKPSHVSKSDVDKIADELKRHLGQMR